MSTNFTFILMALVIFVLTVISGAIPFIIKLKKPGRFDFPSGEALANGVFLGAGLVHMLSDASDGFTRPGISSIRRSAGRCGSSTAAPPSRCAACSAGA